jgi:orotate phosphoribosyltransferase
MLRQAQGEGEDRMTPEQVLREFEKAGALLKGHFVLSSGLHSDTFLQKALVFQDARRTAKLCKALAAKVRSTVKARFTAIVSPAVGGIVPGYEMGRQLGLPAMYVERQDGVFQLRRGFALEKNQPVLMVEDIVTTGLSSRECLEAIRAAGGKPVAAACLIDRSGGKAKVGVKLVALATLKIPAWEPDKLPTHLQGTPAVKPGSRGLA